MRESLVEECQRIVFFLEKLWINFENFGSNVTFSLLMKFFVCLCTWSEKDKQYDQNIESGVPSDENKIGQSLFRVLTANMSIRTSFLQNLLSSESSMLNATSNHSFYFLLTFLQTIV